METQLHFKPTRLIKPGSKETLGFFKNELFTSASHDHSQRRRANCQHFFSEAKYFFYSESLLQNNVGVEAFVPYFPEDAVGEMFTVYYRGDVSQWSSVSFEYGNEWLTGVYIEKDVRRRTQTGDVAGDGVISAADAHLLKQYMTGSVDDSHINYAAADINRDCMVNARDQIMLKRMIVGVE